MVISRSGREKKEIVEMMCVAGAKVTHKDKEGKVSVAPAIVVVL